MPSVDKDKLDQEFELAWNAADPIFKGIIYLTPSRKNERIRLSKQSGPVRVVAPTSPKSQPETTLRRFRS